MYLTSRIIDENRIYSLYRTVLLEQDEDIKRDRMDPAEFARFEDKLVKAKNVLYRNYPFFGILLTRLHTIPTDDVETMAVDDYSNIYINPKFVLDKLSSDEVIGVLAHEVMHVATMSFFRLRGRDMQLWNIATDYIMNRDLLESGLTLPSLGLIPKNSGDKYFVEAPGIAPIDITDETAEGLYDKLLQKIKQIQKNVQANQPGQPGQGRGGRGGGGTVDELSKKQRELDKHLTPEEADKIKPKDIPSDDPGYKPNKPSEGQQPKTESQKRAEQLSKVQDSVQTAEKTRGEGAGVPKSFDRKIFKPKTDWKRLLKHFISITTQSQYDWGRPQKRALAAGYYAPKVTQEKQDLDIVIAIDTSGSISGPIMNVFVNELLNILKSFKHVKMSLLLWHTSVYKEVDLDTKRKSFDQIKQELMNLPYKQGGTTISCIKQYLDKKKDEFEKINGLLVFTDGEVEDNPQFPNVKKKIFMITDGGTDEILKKYGPTFFVDVPHS